MTTEWNALLHGAGVAKQQRAYLKITGSDATRWLNGMVTNSIEALEPGQGCYNFLLSAQGRIQGDCTIYRTDADEASYLLETDLEQLETIHALLDKFIIMDDVELETVTRYDRGVEFVGPKAGEVLKQVDDPFLGKTLSGLKPLEIGWYALTSEQVTTPFPGLVPRFFVTADTMLDGLTAAAKAAGGVEVSAEALEALRVLEGRPKFGVDIRDRDLPQETNQTQALHFNKGCYLGQEIVERIRSRGQVHRMFFKLALEGTVPAELPAAIEAEGKAAGEITSVAEVEGKLLALGYVRREFVELKKPLTYAGGVVAVRG